MVVVKTKRTKHFTGHGYRSLLYPKGSKVETCLTKSQMCPVACVAGAKFILGEGRNFEDARALEGSLCTDVPPPLEKNRDRLLEGRGPHKN